MTTDAPATPMTGHVIIAGFGVPGRFIAELLESRNTPFCVIELNGATAQRCKNVTMIVGDARDPSVLRSAGIDRAAVFAATVPDESVAVEIVRVVRGLRPDIHILARCAYTSMGMRAQQAGANEVVVAEQLVAREFHRLMSADSKVS